MSSEKLGITVSSKDNDASVLTTEQEKIEVKKLVTELHISANNYLFEILSKTVRQLMYPPSFNSSSATSSAPSLGPVPDSEEEKNIYFILLEYLYPVNGDREHPRTDVDSNIVGDLMQAVENYQRSRQPTLFFKELSKKGGLSSCGPQCGTKKALGGSFLSQGKRSDEQQTKSSGESESAFVIRRILKQVDSYWRNQCTPQVRKKTFKLLLENLKLNDQNSASSEDNGPASSEDGTTICSEDGATTFFTGDEDTSEMRRAGIKNAVNSSLHSFCCRYPVRSGNSGDDFAQNIVASVAEKLSVGSDNSSTTIKDRPAGFIAEINDILKKRGQKLTLEKPSKAVFSQRKKLAVKKLAVSMSLPSPKKDPWLIHLKERVTQICESNDSELIMEKAAGLSEVQDSCKCPFSAYALEALQTKLAIARHRSTPAVAVKKIPGSLAMQGALRIAAPLQSQMAVTPEMVEQQTPGPEMPVTPEMVEPQTTESEAGVPESATETEMVAAQSATETEMVAAQTTETEIPVPQTTQPQATAPDGSNLVRALAAETARLNDKLRNNPSPEAAQKLEDLKMKLVVAMENLLSSKRKSVDTFSPVEAFSPVDTSESPTATASQIAAPDVAALQIATPWSQTLQSAALDAEVPQAVAPESQTTASEAAPESPTTAADASALQLQPVAPENETQAPEMTGMQLQPTAPETRLPQPTMDVLTQPTSTVDVLTKLNPDDQQINFIIQMREKAAAKKAQRDAALSKETQPVAASATAATPATIMSLSKLPLAPQTPELATNPFTQGITANWWHSMLSEEFPRLSSTVPGSSSPNPAIAPPSLQ